MQLPPTFVKRVVQIRGSAASAWLSQIEETILLCETKWHCTVGQPFALSYNFVAPVLVAGNEPAVIKLCMSRDDFEDEFSALRHYQSANACKVLDAIPHRAVLLLEQVTPGSNLKTVSEPEAILTITQLILAMQGVPAPQTNQYSTTLDLSLGLKSLRRHFDGKAGPFRETTLQRVERLFPELISTQSAIYLLHGDLHHENILASYEGWKIIDPEGIVGGVEFELMPFMVNNLPETDVIQTIERRIAEFAKNFRLEEETLIKWGLCFSLLSAWWNIEDNIDLLQKDLDLVEIFNRKLS